MTTWKVYGTVTASKYLGTVEAESREEAEEKAWALAYVSVCHHCSDEVEDPEISAIAAYLDPSSEVRGN